MKFSILPLPLAVAVAVAVAAVLMASPAHAQSRQQTAQKTSQETRLAARGRAIAETHCARCHAIGRQDRSPIAEAPPFRSLGQSFPVDDLEEALVEGIVGGSPTMPQFSFSPADAHALVIYLKSIQDRRAH